LFSLIKIFSAYLGQTTKGDDPVPFGAGGLFPRPTDPILSRRNSEIGNGHPAAQILHLRICPQITDKNDFIHSSHKFLLPLTVSPSIYPQVSISKTSFQEEDIDGT
jgi:hypothetical protein